MHSTSSNSICSLVCSHSLSHMNWVSNAGQAAYPQGLVLLRNESLGMWPWEEAAWCRTLMMEGSWTGRKKGNDLGLRLQCQQSCLDRAPVIHLLKNETMLGIWSVKPTLQPHGVQEQGSRSHQPQKVAAEGSAATSLQAPHPVGRGGWGCSVS